MAKSNKAVKSMGDSGTRPMNMGKGGRKPKKVTEGEYCGVDRDADVLHSGIKKKG
jgi:hypothetical protein